MWFLVHIPGMNGPNTRGLLGKGLSAPVTPAVFGPFLPGTCLCSHNYSIMYQKSNVGEGNIRKSGGRGQGLKKKTPHPGPLTGAGRGIAAGAARFGAPEAP